LYPFKIVFIPNPYINNLPHHQVLVSVSKKKFKQAVDRNKIKRAIKEAYRLKKYLLDDLEPSTNPMCIGLIYTGKEIHDSKFVETKVKKLISKLVAMHLPLVD
jgi:ribonuclease P protein component